MSTESQRDREVTLLYYFDQSEKERQRSSNRSRSQQASASKYNGQHQKRIAKLTILLKNKFLVFNFRSCEDEAYGIKDTLLEEK